MSQRRSKSKSIQEPLEQEKTPPSPPTSTSSQNKALSQALTSAANLANLLPTGTLLAFQLLTPIFTNNGSCDLTMRFLAKILLTMLSASVFLACFTDSFRSPDGQVYYGFATRCGMWVFEYPTTLPTPDLTKYRMRIVDWVHGVLSVLVFGSVAMRDGNVVNCLYPKPEHEVQEVLNAVPIGVGLMCSLLFVVFPTKRHGIGYPVTNES